MLNSTPNFSNSHRRYRCHEFVTCPGRSKCNSGSARKFYRNSGKPSSQTGTDKSSKGSKSKGKPLTITGADNSRTVTTNIPLTVESCQCCGESLKNTTTDKVERRTKIDIIIEKSVDNYDAVIKTCPNCETANKASLPDGIHGKLQYGSGLKAFSINLIVSQMLPQIECKRCWHQ